MTIARETAEGLSALHAQEAVHRDVKPSNILFDVEGHAKLADLGLAQVPLGGSMRSRLSTALKHPGTPPYMSPEQRDAGDPLQPPSDVYSLGCVLFEMLTGRLYYNQRPGTRARGLHPEIDSGLDDLLARMLAEKAGDRPWDGVEAAELLRESARNRAVAGIQISPRFTCSSWSLTESCSIVELEPAEPTPEPAIWRSL